MSIQFGERYVTHAQPLPLLVLLDTTRRQLEGRNGLANSAIAGMIAQCRAALGSARATNTPVAFVHARRSSMRQAAGASWIKRLEPAGREMVFEQKGLSPYANPYFCEVADTHRTLVLVGFVGADEEGVVLIESIRRGHHLVLLHDAITASLRASKNLCATEHAARFPSRRITTAVWTQECGHLVVRNRPHAVDTAARDSEIFSGGC